MGFTVNEFKTSRSWSIDSPPGEATITAVYMVDWVPDGTHATYPGEAALLSNIPGVRERASSAIYGSDSLLKTLVSRSVTVQPMVERTHAWMVTVTFSTRGEYKNGSGVFCNVTRGTSLRQAAYYRAGTTLPSNGDAVWGASSADMGGTAIDVNGKPRTYDVQQQIISVEIYWDRTLPSGAPAAEPPWSSYTAKVNQRNSATFLGAGIGYLLYRGFQAAPVDNYYRIEHTFLFDQWLHCEQVAAPNPTGEPVLVPGTTIAGQQILQTDKVIWFQRYPNKTAFADIIPTAELGELTNPKPLAIP
jgi:hypothetical protein